MTIDSMVQDSRCHAAEIIDARHIANWETTAIPTSGFAIGGRSTELHVGAPLGRARQVTNHGGIAYSDDNGQTWTKDQHAQWDNIFGQGLFQVTAMVPQGDHVYMFGTPNGRMGMIGLARVPAGDYSTPVRTSTGSTATGSRWWNTSPHRSSRAPRASCPCATTPIGSGGS